MSNPSSGRRLTILRSRLQERRIGYNIPLTQKFDETTGQIYTETVASIQNGDDRNWALDDNEGHFCAKHSNATTSPTTRSLRGLALRSVVENISDITLEIVKGVPSPLLSLIWDAVTSNGHETFNTWKIFSKLLHNADPSDSLLRWDQVILPPRSRLDTYTKPLTSPSFDFIALLSLSNPFPVADLVKLSNLPNLGALEIIHTVGQAEHEVSDRVVRAWSDEAQKGAFTVLRILKLWNWEEITNQSLQYVNRFPSLAVYDVRGCRFDLTIKPNARALGWEAILQYPLDLFADSDYSKEATLNSKPSKKPYAENGKIPRRVAANILPPSIQTLYHKIGDFRNNMDLIKAGARTEIVQPESDSTNIDPVPVVSIRLRATPQEVFPNGGAPARNLTFIRLDVAKKSHPSSIDMSQKYPTMQIEPEEDKERKTKKQSGTLVKRKKQKLDDVLSSFT